MFTTGSKWFLGLGAVALVLAAVHGYTTGGDLLGPLTLGWWGAVGDHLGYGVLVTIGILAVVLGILALATRDADADALAQAAGTDEAPAARAPARAAHWPVVGAFGIALAVLGLAVETALFIAGLIVIGVALVEWMVLAWSDHATGDPDTNAALRNRIMRPLELPVAGTAFAGLFVFGLSRVFLTTSEMGAVAVAAVFAALVLAVGALVATRPTLSPNLVAALVVVGAVGVVGVGVVSAVRGERELHEHHEDDWPENRVSITPGVGIGGGPEPGHTGGATADDGTEGSPGGDDVDAETDPGDADLELDDDPGAGDGG